MCCVVATYDELEPSGAQQGNPISSMPQCSAETALAPSETLHCLLAIEQGLGRIRQQRWGPRSIDLDLILYGDEIIDQPDLQVPHPRMAFRRFVLEPAAEIAGHMVHPQIGWTLDQLSRHAQSQPTRIALWSAAGDRLAGQTAALVQPYLPHVDVSAMDFTLDNETRMASLLKAPPPQLAVLLESQQPLILQSRIGLARRLASGVCRPGRGPWLRLPVASADEAVHEILAAAQSLAD